MSKKIRKTNEKNEEIAVLSSLHFYRNKYYGAFLENFKFPELSEEQNHFILKRMWIDGRIACFILPESKTPDYLKGVEEEKLTAVFTPFATTLYNIYDYPIEVNLINRRGVKFIPETTQKVNKDVVIGYAHKTHCSVRDMVDYYIRKIVDVEATISTTLFNLKLPRLIAVEPESKDRIKRIMDLVEQGSHQIYVDVDDINAIKDVLSTNSLTADNLMKLYNYKVEIENELMTWLGIDNKGSEKRERQIVDEVNANNEMINNSNATFLDSMKDFCKRVKEYLNFDLSVETTSTPTCSTYEEQPEEYEEEEQNEDI